MTWTTAEIARFVAELSASFARQNPGPDRRGARVAAVRRVSHAEPEDFSLEVTFHALPDGPPLTDAIINVRAYMRRSNATTADDLAGAWSVELDEQVLLGEL